MIINITYDTSVNSAPASFKTAINAAVQFLDNTFTNPITINIDIGYGEIAGQTLDPGALGESEGFYNQYTYTQIRNALIANAKSADQISAVNTLPASDPTNGGNYWVTTAEAKAIGLMGASSALDGYVGFSSTLPFDYDDSNGVSSGTYDFNGTVLHEMTEIMGRVLFVGSDGIGANAYTPLDLFHYSSAGTRDFVGTTPGYFSLNGGTTNLDSFNTSPNGDFGDWASSAGNDSFLAFSNSGVMNAVSQSDLRVMNVLGYEQSASSTPVKNDFNADGLSDLLLQSSSNHGIMIDLMNGLNVTSSATISNASALQFEASGDFNNDGKADLLLQDSNGTPQVWFMNGTSVTGISTALPTPGAAWHIIATGDFNGDGNSDILWQNNDGTPAIWEMNGTSIIGHSPLVNPGPSWHAVGTGDFNGDGNSDILWQNTDGTVSIWEMNGTSIIAHSPIGNPGSSWKVIGTGDFNGDGKSDILLQNSDGTPEIWEMNGLSILAQTTLANPGTSWHAIGTSDFNGDGNADIIWQNDNGTVSIWEMNGTSIIGHSPVTNPGITWHVKDDGPFTTDQAVSQTTGNGQTNIAAMPANNSNGGNSSYAGTLVSTTNSTSQLATPQNQTPVLFGL